MAVVITDTRPWMMEDAVSVDVRGHASPELRRWLETHPAEWRDALRALKRSVDIQFADRRADAAHERAVCDAMGEAGERRWREFERDYEDWRSRATKYLKHVEDRLDYAERLCAKLEPENPLGDLPERVAALELAVFGEVAGE